MQSPVMRSREALVSETANAVMTTLASPATSGTHGLSLWRVEAVAGAAGPLHTFDSEQIWTVVRGRSSFRVEGETFVLDAGDTIHLGPNLARQITFDTDSEFIVSGLGSARARTPDTGPDGITPPWIR